MGVHGLWKLIESSGKPVPLETLENKVLAVDVSIWLHQAIKGFQDNKGAPIANAHLLGIYHRVCKLLYFKIKPIFVFDGGVPTLKRQTIAKRNQYRSKNSSEADRLQRQLISTLLKHTAISKVLSEKTKASLPLLKKSSTKYDTLYDPPSADFDSLESSDEEVTGSSSTTDSSPTKQWDLHSIDTTSHYFKSLPLEVKHEILTDLKDTRKQNSWGKLHQLPKQSDDFSNYQMKRLLKRQEVQTALDNVLKEMGGMSLSLAELESLLNDQGIKTNNDSNFGKRIASDNKTRYLYIKDIQKEIKESEKAEETKKTSVSNTNEQEELKEAIQLSLQETPSTSNFEAADLTIETKADLEEEEELQRAIQLSLGKNPHLKELKPSFSFLESFNDGDFQSSSEEDFEDLTQTFNKPTVKAMSSAQNYMMEYSGLTPAEIEKIIGDNKNLYLSFKNAKLTELNADLVRESEQSKGKEQKNLKGEDIIKQTQSEDQNNKNSSMTNSEQTPKQDETDVEDDIELMSNSDSDDDDFCTVDITEKDISKEKGVKNTKDNLLLKENQPIIFEVVIDPNKIEADDLFGDIFEANTVKDLQGDFLAKENLHNNVKTLENFIEPNHKDDRSKDSSNAPLVDEKKLVDSMEQDSIDKEKSNICKDFINNKTKIDEVNNEESVEENDQVDENKEKMNLSDNITLTMPAVPKLTIQEMQELKDNLMHDKIDIIREKSKKERLANNITDQMYQEAQELLELFGVPYIVAPMEAEAQCAFLDEIELTNGTITDDSDIWLFGGKTVYKNFFNQSKYVMEFKSENIEHHFKLNRQQMILLALLVGSDYTIGLQGVGPVTALEILSIFPPNQTQEYTLSNQQLLSGLKEFKSWYLKGKTGGSGRSSLKNKLKNVTFVDNFPSCQVVEAYLDPKIETSRTPFSWSKPDITGLTVFAKEKFGWTMKKTEDILNPVIKKIEENRSQKCIKDYFKTKFKVDAKSIDGIVSKRVKSAISRIGKSQDELIADEMIELEKAKDKVNGKKSSKLTQNPKKIRKKIDKGENETNSSESIKEQSNISRNNVDTKNQALTSQKCKTNTKEKKDNNKKQSDEPVNRDISKTKSNKRKGKVPKSKSLHLEQVSELKDYENIAIELKTRRKRKNELLKLKTEDPSKKKQKVLPLLPPILEEIPKNLEGDTEIQMLIATTSHSNQRVEEITKEAFKALEVTPTKKVGPNTSLHKPDLIHQRLRDKSNLLRNKMKAIEVFRKSKKGPGYVSKRKKKLVLPKEDAELSENSD
uniref:DNA excision repair protein ERCC-5 homolog n=1 Tax=Diorhabda carinulata TaxID=1163345 RepID=UPI0025A21996|nr:DNA excision repair protein ERCC-5 homolog [Diorhabda carinulata]XP_057664532.1 DNA excision repair protein ERCC-5 homolog [Diorhabda carinulata]